MRLPALSQIQSGARSSKLDALFSMSICTPTGFTIMWYDTWPVPSASRLRPTQSSEKIVSRLATDALMSIRFLVVTLEREVEIAVVVSNPDASLLWDRVAVQWIVGTPLTRRLRSAPPRFIVERAVNGRSRCRARRDERRQRRWRSGRVGQGGAEEWQPRG